MRRVVICSPWRGDTAHARIRELAARAEQAERERDPF